MSEVLEFGATALTPGARALAVGAGALTPVCVRALASGMQEVELLCKSSGKLWARALAQNLQEL